MITAWLGDGTKAGQSRWLLGETNWQDQLPQASSCAFVQVLCWDSEVQSESEVRLSQWEVPEGWLYCRTLGNRV